MLRTHKLAVATLSTAAIALAAFAVPPQPRAGEPLPDLSSAQLHRFIEGREYYSTPLAVADGLGPAFNQPSCAACHEVPLGGWGATTVTRFGNLSGGTFSFLEEFGGPVLQRQAISPACIETLPPPAIANHVRERVTPSVLAFGLVEAIPDAALIALEDPTDANGDGISGRAHRVRLLEDPAGPLRVGRFGWKSQLASVRSFSADAARNEMGLTNAVISTETAPNGDPALLASCDGVPEIEDQPDAFGATFIDAVTDFQRYLAPPPQSPRSGMSGESIFNAVGCIKCHARQFTTADLASLEPVLRNKAIRPYSDFLLHDMGALADGIPDGQALGSEMRTPPLWNLRTRPVLLHNGSANQPVFATRVEAAISAHAGEAAASRNAYLALTSSDKAKVIAFLDSLGRDDYDIDGDGLITNLDYGLAVQHATDPSVSPDEPWSTADLDQDGLLEADEINGLRSLVGAPADCNQNGISDWTEIASGATDDQNGNGIPDECDQSSCTARAKRVTGTGGAIPDNGGGSLTRAIAVTAPAGNPNIQSVRVTLDISHTWLSDLTITLRRGSDAPVTLHTGCGSFHDVNGRYRLVDTAWEGSGGSLVPICQGTLVDGGGSNNETRFTFQPGLYRPSQGTASSAFQSMRGQSMSATWTLTITDSRTNDVGTLAGWSIDFRYADPAPTDCDGAGGPDCAQIAANPSLDCDHDGAIDSCQPMSGDCDGDGTRDRCQIASGTAQDCNANGVLDSCDIASGAARDCNTNGVLDACEVLDGDEADTDADLVLDSCERAFGDLNLDGIVNAADLAMLLGVWAQLDPAFGDLNGDRLVNASDLAFLLGHWGSSPPWVQPTITTVAPSSGPAAGGTAITITGTNLTGTSSVTVGGAAATSVSVVSATTVTAVTPAGTAGAKTVSLTTPGGTANLTNGFTYGLGPTISSVSPNVGPTAGGTAITITGTNLTGTSSVTVGGNPATSVSVVSATTVTAVTPAGTAGAANVSLTTPYGSTTATGAFTYQLYGTPTISSVLPSGGPLAGGTAITITGTNLTGASSVTIGGVAATSVSVVSATTVTAVTPAGTAGAKTVSVTTPGGTANLTNGFTYTSVWYTVLEQNPDPAIVTSATLRNAIVATGYPWRVRDNGTNIEMVLIPPGTFNMGCSASNAYGCYSDESPVHSVTLTSAFYMGRYEVTQAQWIARMGSNPSYWVARPENGNTANTNRPVETVSWNQIAG
ncbi:MAG: IPT/TIG domain-containing protein, partial [Planctomycetota bacterium]